MLLTGADRKFFLLGGKGGVGKTSCAASLAVKFANAGYPTLVVSTDPAHSLGDSLDQVRAVPSSCKCTPKRNVGFTLQCTSYDNQWN